MQDGLNEAISEGMRTVQATKKRKRASPNQNGTEEPGPKRGPIQNAMNGNGDHVNGSPLDSFSDAINSSNSSNDFTNLQQLRNATTSTIHDASSTAAAALAAQLVNPQTSGMSFDSNGSGTDTERQIDSSFEMSGGDSSQNHHSQGTSYHLTSFAAAGGTAAQVQAAREASNGGGIKPTVGSDEWHKVRRDNHKEVERRRRETINEGINELAKIVPGCEKNKGSILQRAVTYILQLKTTQEKQVENRTMEKVVFEQALGELTEQVNRYKTELQSVWSMNEELKRKLENAVVRDGEELNADEGEEESEGGSD